MARFLAFRWGFWVLSESKFNVYTDMSKRVGIGFTLLELMVVISIAATLLALWIPRAARLMDWLATERAARDVTTALALGQSGAIARAMRVRISLAADTLRIDCLEDNTWKAWRRLPGPASHGVVLQVSNPVVTFGPNGIGWGASNTSITLRRGSQVETITTSRVGRVKRW
jgi:prepilin-type N-terminal cleavage/methylation domain-containing protein